MSFDPSTLVTITNKWLETKIRYEGAARAEFTNPPGVIEGSATVSFNSAGLSAKIICVPRVAAVRVQVLE